MAKTKKVEKYVPQTAYPQDASDAWKLLIKSNKTFDELLALTSQLAPRSWGGWVDDGNGDHKWVENTCAADFYRHRIIVEDKIDAENWQRTNWKDRLASYWMKRLLNTVWPYTEDFKQLNSMFLAEYDSRPDMQEFYTTLAGKSTYFQDMTNTYSSYRGEDDEKINNGGFRKRPVDYVMYHSFLDSISGRRMVELARETPYEEGDLVVLRLPFVGHPDWDPEWVSRYVQAKEGKVMPGREVARMGMLMGLTEQIGNRRASKGSKLMKVLWFGKEEPVMIPENKIKFHERPTYANGLKKRE